MMRLLPIVGIALSLGAQPVAGQGTPSARPWPPGRAHHALFYDEVRQRVMLTGGGANDERRRVKLFSDVWSFDGSTWSVIASSGDTLVGSRIGIDGQKRILAFGGFGDSAGGDVRVLENDRWRRLGAHPSIVSGEGGFVFDEARNRFVAFGGQGAQRMNGDVWEFDGTRWSKHVATAPPARHSHAMVYDPHRRKVIMFGGMGVRVGEQSAPLFDDTWEFDGTAWTQVRGTGPSPRLGAGVAYDSKRSRVILFGGGNHERVFNDLWTWDGASWTKLAEGGPEPRVMGYIAYDKRRDRIVLFGGRRKTSVNSDLDDTWEWDGVRWRQVTAS